MYVATRILAGDIPYRDVWDHKGPPIFYLNALGLLISQGANWGPYIVEFLGVWIGAILGFFALKKEFGTLAAFFASASWILALSHIAFGGNYPESHGLILQFAALFLIANLASSKNSRFLKLAIGVLGGFAFLYKPTTIGLWLAIAIYWGLTSVRRRDGRSLFRDWATLAIGAAIPILATTTYFGANGGLRPFWEAAFDFNFYYSNLRGAGEHFGTAQSAFDWLSRTEILLLGLAGWAAGIFVIFSKNSPARSLPPLFYIAIIDLPLELILASTSGRNYSFYFIPSLPGLATLTAGFIALLDPGRVLGRENDPNRLRSRAALIALLTLGFLFQLAYTRNSICDCNVIAFYLRGNRLPTYFSQGFLKPDPVVDYIKAHTTPKDFVLFWGFESTYNFAAGRMSPTRFVYQLPLYVRGYTNPERIEEFRSGLLERKPRLIIDPSPSDPLVPPINSAERATWKRIDCWANPSREPKCIFLPELEQIASSIITDYSYVGTIGPDKWEVYELR